MPVPPLSPLAAPPVAEVCLRPLLTGGSVASDRDRSSVVATLAHPPIPAGGGRGVGRTGRDVTVRPALGTAVVGVLGARHVAPGEDRVVRIPTEVVRPPPFSHLAVHPVAQVGIGPLVTGGSCDGDTHTPLVVRPVVTLGNAVRTCFRSFRVLWLWAGGNPTVLPSLVRIGGVTPGAAWLIVGVPGGWINW